MASISTHVLDTALGRPAEGLAIHLQAFHPRGEPGRAAGGSAEGAGGEIVDGEWALVGEGITDADGRVPKTTLAPTGIGPGVYQMVFETGAYLERVHGKGFYPYVPIVFEVTADQHYHVPLLLSPFGISTYRGS